jgi:hypothetical protein
MDATGGEDYPRDVERLPTTRDAAPGEGEAPLRERP